MWDLIIGFWIDSNVFREARDPPCILENEAHNCLCLHWEANCEELPATALEANGSRNHLQTTY